MPSTKFVFFGPIGKTRWPPWPLIGRDIFDFSSETAGPNSMKLDRKQDLNALYQVCVFWAYWKNKMAALASDWLRHFRLLLWNCWTEFSETWQEASSQCLLPRLCFQANREKTKWPPWPLIGWDIFDFSSETVKGIQPNLIGSKILTPSTKFVFFRWIGKTKWPPWPIICCHRHFQLFLWNCWTEFSETWQEARSQHPLPGLRFSGWSEKQDSCPVLWLAETFFTSPMKPLIGIQRNLKES